MTPDPRRWWALVVLAAAQFMVIMDTSIIAGALPDMRAQLGFTPSWLQWGFNAYAVALGGLLLLGGRLSDLWGARTVFAAGWGVLTLGSIVAAAAGDAGTEVLGRAVQGVGAALLAPAAMTLLMVLFAGQAKELPKALAFYGAAAPAGGTAGVFLGGVITEWLTWPWVFVLYVPIGVLTLALTPKLLPAVRGRAGGLDVGGAIAVTGGLALAVYAIVQAPERGWTSVSTLLQLGGAAVLLVAFALVHRSVRNPLMPLKVWRTPDLAAANLAMLLLGAAWIPMWYFLNLYVQQVLGDRVGRPRWRAGSAGHGGRRRQLCRGRLAGLAGLGDRHGAGVHPGHHERHQRGRAGAGWAGVGHRQHHLPGRLGAWAGGHDGDRHLAGR
ncbi:MULTISPECIES: MFS transporter [unclassified Saccharothrix]|uniref:MFS transporter n=1 Tax=unclassified Saccharothrix TaxID=2593673 RepID=UPI00307DCC48